MSNINEGFVSDFISGLKSGFKSEMNKGKDPNGYSSEGKRYMDSLPKEFTYNGNKYEVSWGSAKQQAFGELGTVTIKPLDKNIPEEKLYWATCNPWDYEDEKWRWEIMPYGLKGKYYRYQSKGWYMDHDAQEIKYDFNEIAKELEKYNYSKTNESSVKFVVSQILSGVSVREAINEAYKTRKIDWKADLEDTALRREDAKNRSKQVKFDYATILDAADINKYKPILSNLYKGSWWLQSGKYYDWDSSSICTATKEELVTEKGVRPLLHITDSAGFKPGEEFSISPEGASHNQAELFRMLSNEFAICFGFIGESCYVKDTDNAELILQNYEKSDLKKFVDNWFNKIKR